MVDLCVTKTAVRETTGKAGWLWPSSEGGESAQCTYECGIQNASATGRGERVERGCETTYRVHTVGHAPGTRIQAFWLLVLCSFLQAKKLGILGTPLPN